MDQLNDIEIRILQTVEDGGVMRGNVLRRRARVENGDEMLSAVHHLLDLGLIGVSGGTADMKAVMGAHFSPVPSTRGLARQAVKRKR